MRNRLDQRRRTIDPTRIRKHSEIVAKAQDDIRVVGDRVQTDYGFVISGFSGKNFETFYMCVLASALTPTWKHQKKSRTYRVSAGMGYFMTTSETGEVVTRPLAPGDEVVAEAGVVHKLGTTKAANLELFVVQDAKYTAHLVEVEPTVPVEVPSALLTSVATENRQIFNIERSRRSRAAEQIAALRRQAPDRDRTPVGADVDTFMRGATAGVNASPVMDFDAEGAG